MPRVQAVCRSITSGRFKLDEVVLREASAGRVEATRFGRYNLPRDAASRSEGRRGRVTADTLPNVVPVPVRSAGPGWRGPQLLPPPGPVLTDTGGITDAAAVAALRVP